MRGIKSLNFVQSMDVYPTVDLFLNIILQFYYLPIDLITPSQTHQQIEK